MPWKGAPATVSMRPASRFEETCGSTVPMPSPGKRSLRVCASTGQTRGHDHVDAFDQGTEGRVEAIAWLRQGDADFGEDAAGVAGEYQDAVAHEYRLLDIVGDEDHALDRHAAFGPQIQEVRTQGLRCQHIEGRERLVHQQDIRMHDQCAREAHALPHTAGELARIGGFEAIESDQIDGCQGAAPDLRR